MEKKFPWSPVIYSSKVCKTDVMNIQISMNWALNSGSTVLILKLMENGIKIDTRN